MPQITITMFAGRSEDKKLKLRQAVIDAVCDSLDITDDLVKVQIVEVKSKNDAVDGITADEL